MNTSQCFPGVTHNTEWCMLSAWSMNACTTETQNFQSSTLKQMWICGSAVKPELAMFEFDEWNFVSCRPAWFWHAATQCMSCPQNYLHHSYSQKQSIWRPQKHVIQKLNWQQQLLCWELKHTFQCESFFMHATPMTWMRTYETLCFSCQTLILQQDPHATFSFKKWQRCRQNFLHLQLNSVTGMLACLSSGCHQTGATLTCPSLSSWQQKLHRHHTCPWRQLSITPPQEHLT